MRKAIFALLLSWMVAPSWATMPQDDYHNYLIILVHGLGGDSNIIGNTNGAKAYPKHAGWLESSSYFQKPEYKAVVGDPGKNSEDFYGGLFEFLTDTLGVDSANVRYYEMSRPCEGFFNEPNDPSMPTTSKELGDRNYDNPAAVRWPREKAPGIRLRFGLEKDPVTGKGMSWMQQAMVDWGRTWRTRHPGHPASEAIPDSAIPKKYILIGHSMGGLTIRSYLASSFYQNDVERVVTAASPASGTELITYIHQWGLRGGRILENDWNQGYILKTIVEGSLMFAANKSQILDKTQKGAEQAIRRIDLQAGIAEKTGYSTMDLCGDVSGRSGTFIENSFGRNPRGNRWVMLSACSMNDISPTSWLTEKHPIPWFFFKRLTALGLKSGIDWVLEDKVAGHVWEKEIGVQQLEPLASNPTSAISGSPANLVE